MGEEIKKEDLYKEGSLDSLKQDLKDVLLLLNDVQKTGKELSKGLKKDTGKTTIKKLEDEAKAVDKVNEEFKKTLAIQKDAANIKKQLANSTDEQVKGQIRLANARKKQKDILRDEIILNDKNAGTLERNAASSRKLRREREGLNLETQKGKDRLIQINKQLDKNNKKVTDNSDKLKKQKLNVGNYTNSTKDAIATSGIFSSQLATLNRIQTTLGVLLKKNTAETVANSTAKKGAAVASGGFTKALKILRIALISTGIGALVVGLGALIAAFSGTQRGADAFTKVMRPLRTLFERFVGFLENTAFKAFDKLKAAFEDPKQAVIDLADAIKDNLIARFKALGVLGSAISKIFSGEFKQGFKELSDGAIQLGTGIENATDKMAGLAKETGELVNESLKQGEQLDKLIKRFERLQISTTVPIQKARLEFQKLRAIAQDQTKTDRERIDSLNEAEKIQRFIIQNEQELINLQIERMVLEQSFNDTSREEELELEKLRADRLQKEEVGQKKINGLISLRTGIELRAAKKLEKQVESIILRIDEVTKKTVDDIIKSQKTQSIANSDFLKEQREAIEKEDQKVIDNRKKTLSTLNNLSKKFFQEQKEAIGIESNAIKERQKELEEAAKNGVNTTKDSLAENERLQAENELRQKRLDEQEKRRELQLAIIKAYSAALDNGASNQEAIAQAISSSLVIEKAIEVLPGFKKGTDDTGSTGPISDKDGVITGYTHKNEQVWSESDLAESGNKTREEAKELMRVGEQALYNDLNVYNQPEIKKRESDINHVLQKQILSAYKTGQKEIVTAIENQPVLTDVTLDKIRSVIQYETKIGKNTQINIKKISEPGL